LSTHLLRKAYHPTTAYHHGRRCALPEREIAVLSMAIDRVREETTLLVDVADVVDGEALPDSQHTIVISSSIVGRAHLSKWRA